MATNTSKSPDSWVEKAPGVAGNEAESVAPEAYTWPMLSTSTTRMPPPVSVAAPMRACASAEMCKMVPGAVVELVVPATTMLSSPSSAKSEPGPSIQVAQRRLEPSGENFANVFVAKLKDFAGQMTPGVVGIEEAYDQPRTTT